MVEEKRSELADLRECALGVLTDACLRSGAAREAAKWADRLARPRTGRRVRVAGGQVQGADPASLQVRPLLSLLYGPCRYGTRTSQKRLSSRRSGCGPCSPDAVSEIWSPIGLFGSPVYSKTSTKATVPASRVNVGPPVIDNFSNRPPAVLMIVTVPAPASITGGDVGLTGPAKESVADFPLSAAVKTPNQVPLMKNVPFARVADDRRAVNDGRSQDAALEVGRGGEREMRDLRRSRRKTRRRGDARQHRRDG